MIKWTIDQHIELYRTASEYFISLVEAYDSLDFTKSDSFKIFINFLGILDVVIIRNISFQNSTTLPSFSLPSSCFPAGLCPKLETCVFNCLTEDVSKVLSCVATRCNVHCYDGDCPSCRMISRRIFSNICKQHSMTTQPQIKYEGN